MQVLLVLALLVMIVNPELRVLVLLVDSLGLELVLLLLAFADPAFPSPRHSVYEERMHAWVGVPRDIEHLP